MTSYDPQSHPELARRLALLGCTDDETASVIGVSRKSIQRWRKQHPEFDEAIESGKAPADCAVVQSLYQRALDGDTTAQIFWLKNRRARDWRDRPVFAERPTIALVDREALNELYKRALADAETQRVQMQERASRYQLLEHDELSVPS